MKKIGVYKFVSITSMNLGPRPGEKSFGFTQIVIRLSNELAHYEENKAISKEYKKIMNYS